MGQGFESLQARQYMVGLVQLVRAPVCGTGGHRFESDIPPHFFWITPVTIGVSPSGKARDFDSLTRGFESRLPSQRPSGGGCDPLAQLAEHLTFNQGVRSSNLRWITSKFPLKSLIFGYFRGFFMPFFNRYFFCGFYAILPYFTIKCIPKCIPLFENRGRFSVLTGLTPAIGTKGSSQDARGLFSALSALLNSLYRIPFIC